ncbi:L-lysine N6-monooxygenase [Kordia antarctica]|uniref:L-lysine N6-monooxygenase n=1 Tax=Kordia antarctica TaxID=1218801 RepID=A0A7L4ZGS0_9FLAO|nr:SidA/IucD/PvdA family monooxygenase [Kordia antarctica]QHI35948.1 L-lysine N6-monooxygenase [Kordia antarctica]
MNKIPNTLNRIYDVVGIGVGPSNLSTAALLSQVNQVKACFFEMNKEFNWHAGMLFPEATLQVSYLKDLVTLVDPTNPYSFLNFLSNKKRLYRFLTAGFSKIKRREFNQYLRWVCDSLDTLEFNSKVKDIQFNGNLFSIHTNTKTVFSKNLIMATGLTPKIPKCVRPYQCSRVFHAIHYLKQNVKTKGKRIAVIGGGQSGAEIIHKLLCEQEDAPSKLVWISSRSSFAPIDDSPFANEYYTPNYCDYFYNLSPDLKHKLNKDQTLSSDGIDMCLLKNIYKMIYELDFIEDKELDVQLIPNSKLMKVLPVGDAFNLVCEQQLNKAQLSTEVDIVILATGFEYKEPVFLNSIKHHISYHNNRFKVNPDYSIEWEFQNSNKIYLQNGSRHVRGVADPNLSLIAWRSAKIINSLCKDTVYDIKDDFPVFDWLNNGYSINKAKNSIIVNS